MSELTLWYTDFLLDGRAGADAAEPVQRLLITGVSVSL